MLSDDMSLHPPNIFYKMRIKNAHIQKNVFKRMQIVHATEKQHSTEENPLYSLIVNSWNTKLASLSVATVTRAHNLVWNFTRIFFYRSFDFRWKKRNL